jgi:hypothetical protein
LSKTFKLNLLNHGVFIYGIFIGLAAPYVDTWQAISLSLLIVAVFVATYFLIKDLSQENPLPIKVQSDINFSLDDNSEELIIFRLDQTEKRKRL